MSVSRRLRYEVLRRDGHACRYCGATAPEAKLTVDHVLPVALGGTDTADNLVAACADCNAGKAASNPDAELVAAVSDDALRWAAAVREAAEFQDDVRFVLSEYVARIDEAWKSYTTDAGDTLPRPSDWIDSVELFHARGLESEVVEDAIARAMRNPKVRGDAVFRYACGICWRTLDERQEIARAVFERGKGDEA